VPCCSCDQPAIAGVAKWRPSLFRSVQPNVYGPIQYGFPRRTCVTTLSYVITQFYLPSWLRVSMPLSGLHRQFYTVRDSVAYRTSESSPLPAERRLGKQDRRQSSRRTAIPLPKLKKGWYLRPLEHSWLLHSQLSANTKALINGSLNNILSSKTSYTNAALNLTEALFRLRTSTSYR